MIDYFQGEFLTIIDESHVTIPQIRGMYAGDRARKETLVEYGFRLPSCLDNRPLKFSEFNQLAGQTIFVSATPDEYELKLSGSKIIEQIIRPTGLLDPEIIIKPAAGQVEDLISQVKERAKKRKGAGDHADQRTAEDLAVYMAEKGLR
jgi:excinuclease ABC subunit B